jgi:hypothetical protein
MTPLAFSLVLVLSATVQVDSRPAGTAIKAEELTHEKDSFKQWWGRDLTLKLDDLPTTGVVASFRVPYSGHDYPDLRGGTLGAMQKYDAAFHRGRPLATEFERRDISGHRDGSVTEVRGLFGRMRRVGNVPTWYGHCNGWTAASIRHAEPQKNVVRNGVTFTPADIKGLLADLYMYSNTEFLGGGDESINPGTLHLTIGNWIGLGEHPVGMEAALGEVVINYPIYSYGTAIKKISDRQAEVEMTIRYALNTPQETIKGPRSNRTMYFHYLLDLDKDGQITGGRYLANSSQIDMLWTPLRPTQGGKEGNERGNPYLDTKETLALWRESVPEELRKKWLNVDPTEEDRLLPEEPAVESTPVESAAAPAGDAEKKPASEPAAPSAAAPSAAASSEPSAAAGTPES